MSTLRIINSKSECVADALTAQSFVDFKKRCAEEGFGRVALVVTLDCGEEIFMDTCKLFKRLPGRVLHGSSVKVADVHTGGPRGEGA